MAGVNGKSKDSRVPHTPPAPAPAVAGATDNQIMLMQLLDKKEERMLVDRTVALVDRNMQDTIKLVNEVVKKRRTDPK